MIDFDIEQYFEMIEEQATDENGSVCYPRLYGQLKSQLGWALSGTQDREVVINMMKKELDGYQQQLTLPL